MPISTQTMRVSFAMTALIIYILDTASLFVGGQRSESLDGIYIKDSRLPKVTYNEGSTVKMTCEIVVPVDAQSQVYSVVWEKEGITRDFVLAIDSKTADKIDPERVHVEYKDSGDTRTHIRTWILTIESIQISDAGFYRCRLIVNQQAAAKIFKVKVLDLSLGSHEEVVTLTKELEELEDTLAKAKKCNEVMVGFTAYSGPGTHNIKKGVVAKWMAVDFNKGVGNTGDYDDDTGRFTCRLAGWYRFSVNIVAHSNQNGNLHIILHRDGNAEAEGRCRGACPHIPQIVATAYAEQDDWNTAAASVAIELHVGDVIWLQSGLNSVLWESGDDENTRHSNVFNGNLIKAENCYK